MNADKKTRRQGCLIVALILLLGAAHSYYTVCIYKRPPLPLAIVSEKVILEGDDIAIGPFSLSPDGRHVFFRRLETLQSKTGAGETTNQTFLLDLGTGENISLPFPDLPGDYLSPCQHEVFTSDGNYAYLIESRKDHQGTEVKCLLLYDIRNKTSRTAEIEPCQYVVRDDRGENLLATTCDPKSQSTSRLAVIPVAGGAVKWYSTEGIVLGVSRNDRAAVLTLGLKPGAGHGHKLSVVDLLRGKTLKMISWDRGVFGESRIGDKMPFWTRDGRFLCYGGSCTIRNPAAQFRNALSRLVPVIRRSPFPEKVDIRAACFWDSANDRAITLGEVIALSPGPASSSVVLVDLEGKNLGVADLATGQECWAPIEHTRDIVCAYGKYVLYSVDKPNGVRKYVLVEIGLPGTKDNSPWSSFP